MQSGNLLGLLWPGSSKELLVVRRFFSSRYFKRWQDDCTPRPDLPYLVKVKTVVRNLRGGRACLDQITFSGRPWCLLVLGQTLRRRFGGGVQGKPRVWPCMHVAQCATWPRPKRLQTGVKRRSARGCKRAWHVLCTSILYLSTYLTLRR